MQEQQFIENACVDAQFAGTIAGDVDSIAIWASSPDDRAQLVPLVQALRAAMP